ERAVPPARGGTSIPAGGALSLTRRPSTVSFLRNHVAVDTRAWSTHPVTAARSRSRWTRLRSSSRPATARQPRTIDGGPACTVAPVQLAIEEVVHQRSNLLALVLEGEVAGVEQVKLGVGKIAQVGLGAIGRKDHVVRAPYDQGRWPMRAEEC